jgi:seryl-tRNA synthetase
MNIKIDYMFPVGKANPNPIHIFDEEGEVIATFEKSVPIEIAKAFEEAINNFDELKEENNKLAKQITMLEPISPKMIPIREAIYKERIEELKEKIKDLQEENDELKNAINKYKIQLHVALGGKLYKGDNEDPKATQFEEAWRKLEQEPQVWEYLTKIIPIDENFPY